MTPIWTSTAAELAGALANLLAAIGQAARGVA
jgi:hypothetical protein